MIYLISGSVGSGKTTACERILALAEKRGLACGGVICPATYERGVKTGSRIIDVRSKESEEFSCATGACFYAGINVGGHSISPAGLEFGIRALKDSADCDLVFIDEVGALELSGGGFRPALEEVLGNRKNVVVVVRERARDWFLEGFRKHKVVECRIDGERDFAARIVEGINSGA